MEMDCFEGRCKFCGNILPILAADQIDADEKISEVCECGGYKKNQREVSAERKINELLGPGCVDHGMEEIDSEVVASFKAFVKLLSYGHVDGIGIAVGETKINMKSTAKGEIKITRTDSTQSQVVF